MAPWFHQQVANTITAFKRDSPGIKAEFIEEMTNTKGKKCIIYKYSGDRWGNRELVGYYNEDKTINFFVMTARTESAFNEAREAFNSLLRSYLFITNEVTIENNSPLR